MDFFGGRGQPVLEQLKGQLKWFPAWFERVHNRPSAIGSDPARAGKGARL